MAPAPGAVGLVATFPLGLGDVRGSKETSMVPEAWRKISIGFLGVLGALERE